MEVLQDAFITLADAVVDELGRLSMGIIVGTARKPTRDHGSFTRCLPTCFIHAAQHVHYSDHVLPNMLRSHANEASSNNICHEHASY